MKSKNILIVENEQIIAENLRLILLNFGYKNISVAIDSDEAIELFQKTSFHLVLMDINLGELSNLDGIDLIKHLSKNYDFKYLYVTANADTKTVSRAKETSPSGYIIKPFVNSSIYANVEMALSQIDESRTSYTYSLKGVPHKIYLNNICYVESDGSYLNIITSDQKKINIRHSLNEFKTLFPNKLIRIHKSTLVNINKIIGYKSGYVELEQGKLSVGRAFKSDLITIISNLKSLLPFFLLIQNN